MLLLAGAFLCGGASAFCIRINFVGGGAAFRRDWL